MTKSEIREIQSVRLYVAHNMVDTAARSLSGLIRAARTNKSRTELMEIAIEFGLTDQPDFII